MLNYMIYEVDLHNVQLKGYVTNIIDKNMI